MLILLFVLEIGLLIWLLSFFQKVGPVEMAVKVIFGKPVAYRESGYCVVPRLPGCYLVRFSTRQYKVPIEPVEAFTRRGKYGEIEYGSQPLTVHPTLYLYFPRDQRLIDVVKAGIPMSEQRLSSHLNNAVQEAVRIAVGRFVWKTATQQIEKIRDRADLVFKSAESPLRSAGFNNDDFHLIIEKVEVPSKLKDLMSQPDEEKLKAQAAKHTADAQVSATMGLKIKMLAEACGKPPEEIQELIFADPKLQKKIDKASTEFVQDLIALDKGALTRIRVDGANGIDKSVLQFIALFKKLMDGGGGLSDKPPQKAERVHVFGREWDVSP